MTTPSIKNRRQAADSTALIPQAQRHPPRRAPRSIKANSNRYAVCAFAGPYQLEANLTPDRDQPNQLWFDVVIQGRDLTPAVDSVLFQRVTPPADPQRVLAGLVSLTDENTGYRHQTAIQLEQPGLYAVTVSVCDPEGEGGAVTILWPHALPEAGRTTKWR